MPKFWFFLVLDKPGFLNVRLPNDFWLQIPSVCSIKTENRRTGMENKKWKGGGLNFEYDNFWAAVGKKQRFFYAVFREKRDKKDLKFSLKVNLWHFSHQ